MESEPHKTTRNCRLAAQRCTRPTAPTLGIRNFLKQRAMLPLLERVNEYCCTVCKSNINPPEVF